MKTLSRKLHDFWFESAPAARLGLLRILIGAFALWYLLNEYTDYVEVARGDPRLFAPVGVVLVFHNVIDVGLFRWLLDGTILAGFFFTLGLWHRITGPIFAGALLWLFCYRNSWSMIYHSDNLVALHVIVLGLTRSADAWSLDALLRARRQPGGPSAGLEGWQYGWPVKLICAVTVSAYFVSAMAKLSSPLGLSWMTGQNLRAQMAVDAIRKEMLGGVPNQLAYTLYDWLPLFSLLAVGSMMLEFCAPLALLNRRVGRIWAINTFMMHWGILLVMHITFHYQLSGVLFASFFRLERLLDLPGGIRRSRLFGSEAPAPEPAAGLAAQSHLPQASLPHATLYYDGECGLCDRFVQFVLRHDGRGYFQFATLQSDAGRRQLSRLGLSESDLRSVVLVEAGGTYERSTATLRVCRRLTRLWPLLYMFIVVPKRWRDAVYSLIARNRTRWFKPPGACPVLPPEWRRRFVS